MMMHTQWSHKCHHLPSIDREWNSMPSSYCTSIQYNDPLFQTSILPNKIKDGAPSLDGNTELEIVPEIYYWSNLLQPEFSIAWPTSRNRQGVVCHLPCTPSVCDPGVPLTSGMSCQASLSPRLDSSFSRHFAAWEIMWQPQGFDHFLVCLTPELWNTFMFPPEKLRDFFLSLHAEHA